MHSADFYKDRVLRSYIMAKQEHKFILKLSRFAGEKKEKEKHLI